MLMEMKDVSPFLWNLGSGLKCINLYIGAGSLSSWNKWRLKAGKQPRFAPIGRTAGAENCLNFRNIKKPKRCRGRKLLLC